MTTTTLTGNTFPHRDRLKQLGGRWDASARNWQFDWLSPSDLAELKNLPGCVVAAPTEPSPRPRRTVDDAVELIDRIERRTEHAEHGTTEPRVYGDDQRYLNYFKDKNPLSFFGFSSVGAMVDFIERIPREKRTGARDEGFETRNTTWTGTPSMSAAIDLARNGWQKGADDAARVLETLDVEHALERRRSYAVAGGAVSVGRMLAGNPAHMIKRPKLPGRRVITLFTDYAASYRIKPENLLVRAACVAAIADILESSGYSCEIVAVSSGRRPTDKPAMQFAVTVKQAGEKLNVSDAAFALGHPSFLRRFQFACVCQADELERYWSNQGMPTDSFGELERNEFYIRKLDKNINDPVKMLQAIKPDGLPIEIGA